MRKLLIATGIATLCLPMLFLGWLLLSVRWQKMDALTLKSPTFFRTTVAGVLIQRAGYGKQALPATARVLRLDPGNKDAWERRCWASFGNPGEYLSSCQVAVRLAHRSGDYMSLGRAQEQVKDECAAEESFTQAASLESSSGRYSYVESMGRAALRCGDLPSSRAGFEAAVPLEQKAIDYPHADTNSLDRAKQHLFADRQYLIIVYTRQHQPALAAATCSQAHPDWKGCNCSLDSDGVVSCSNSHHS